MEEILSTTLKDDVYDEIKTELKNGLEKTSANKFDRIVSSAKDKHDSLEKNNAKESIAAPNRDTAI